MGRVFLGVAAIYGAGSDAGGVFVPTQGSAMTYSRGRHLLSLSPYASGSKFNVTLLAYGADG
jgi:hypothetical protein